MCEHNTAFRYRSNRGRRSSLFCNDDLSSNILLLLIITQGQKGGSAGPLRERRPRLPGAAAAEQDLPDVGVDQG